MSQDSVVAALFESLPPWLLLKGSDPLSLVYLAALVIVLLLSTFIVFSKTRGHKQDTFLLAGLSDAGKTVLYVKLRNGQMVDTHTSMTENEGRFVPISHKHGKSQQRPVHVVDLPGHEKLRFKYTEYLPVTAGIVFVVDSTTILRQLRSAAEYLYDILANRYTQRNEIPILVLCNKNDMLLALKEDKIQTMLEGEIDHLRKTRSAEVQSQDEEKDDEFLGNEGEPFKFEHLPNPISFVSCSLMRDDNDGESGLDAVNAFITEMTR
ncbi:hypothetical protein SpCBS45565_g01947 [Spizellomyces sp. 'palustris']|nr:hypothetical protein SpCBS45565_g01947 [Spizellomyces sp. 'palustris']